MARKTIPVESVKAIANGMLANSRPELVESREAIAVMLERILFDTGNYHGYKYITVTVLSPRNDHGQADDSRRYYY